MSSSSIIINPHVINSVKSLPEADRRAIVTALAEDLLLGDSPEEKLSPFQAVIYTALHYYVCRDSMRKIVS